MKYLNIILGLLFLISIGFNVYFLSKANDVKIEEKVIVTTKIDTITDTVPQAVSEKILSIKTDTFTNYRIIYDTLKDDQVIVDIPITQKIYSKDSLYTAWVSGYKSNLDSINVYQKVTTIDKERIITKKEKNKFSIGPTIYGGYNLSNNRLGYGIGIGVTYNLLSW